MPGYGIVGPNEGRGLLPWSWATERLTSSHDYWLSTVRPDGRPHVMPVWGIWSLAGEHALWFSTSPTSRKARNLTADARCALTTDDALEPVVVEGTARLETDPTAIAEFTRRVNVKYEVDYSASFFEENSAYAVRPSWVFALDEDDFTGTPTRWTL
jgi:PPOX class probable F420-dependent enzyme